jgi:formyl-CoA transferase
MTPFLEQLDRQLPFPPRFGEHNKEIYGKLGYSDEDLVRFKENKVI